MVQGLSILIAAICVAYANAQSICSSYTGSTMKFIPNPTDCAYWFACSKGQIVNKGRCPDGHNFDSAASMCLVVGEAKCAPSPAMDVCKEKADKTSVANPTDCKQYYYCLNHVGYLGQCSKDYYFDATKQLCIYSPNYVCKSDGGETTDGKKYSCTTVPPGSFIPKEKSCHKYYYCDKNGVAVLGQCDNGLYFDAVKQKCEFSKNVECKDEEDTDSPQWSVQPDPEEICKGTIKGDEKKVFGSDPGDCSSYYYCPNGKDTIKASLVKGVCPDNKIFSETDLQCINNNLKDGLQCSKRLPCVEKPIGYFDIGRECNTFHYCGQNGAETETSCPEGYDFDVKHQNCNKKGLFECQKLPPTSKF